MTSFLCRRKVLEKVEGFDESIDYGEDADLPTRAREAGFEGGQSEAVIYYSFVSSLGEVFRQGRWYGKSMFSYLKKYPEEFPSVLMMLFFASWPISILSGLLTGYIFLAAAQSLLVLVYLIVGFLNSESPYILLVPLIKTIRAYGEILGIVESFFTSDIGRS